MSGIASSFAVYRFILSGLLAAGGIACIYFGYRLFVQGTGIAKGLDKLSLKTKEMTIAATGASVGGVLMLTSAAWAYFSYASVAKLEVAGNVIRIGSIQNYPSFRKLYGDLMTPDGGEKLGKVTDVIVGDKNRTVLGVIVSDARKPDRKVFLSASDVGMKKAIEDWTAHEGLVASKSTFDRAEEFKDPLGKQQM